MITEVEKKARISSEDFYKVAINENETVLNNIGSARIKRIKTDSYYKIGDKNFRLRTVNMVDGGLFVANVNYLTVKNKKMIDSTEANEEIELQLDTEAYDKLKKCLTILGATLEYEKKKTGFSFEKIKKVTLLNGININIEFFRIESINGYKDYFVEIEAVRDESSDNAYGDDAFVEAANNSINYWFDKLGFKNFESKPYAQLIREYSEE